ncbi:MAG: EMC3/TMCO1 family protein [Candidatus Thermoplasmatota archaeon]
MAEKVPAQQQAPAGGGGMFFMLMLMMFMLLLMFDSNLRTWVGSIAGLALNPLIGFECSAPVWTIFSAALLTSIISTMVRHFLVDWRKVAKIQKKTKHLSALQREAFKKRDMAMIEKLREVQAGMRGETMEMQTAQMKPTSLTMIMFFAVFIWLWSFLPYVAHPYIAVPWAGDFTTSLLSSHVLPDWILLYSLLSISLGQVLTRSLKLLYFSKRLKALEIAGE